MSYIPLLVLHSTFLLILLQEPVCIGFYKNGILNTMFLLILGRILYAIKRRILIRKRINPIVHNPIIFSVSNHENMDPMLLSYSSVTMISDNAFDSVPCNRPARSFSMFSCSILITSCAGWALSAN